MMRVVVLGHTACLILAIFAVSCEAFAWQIAVYYEGTVSSLTSFSENSVPNGVFVGAKIAGSLLYGTDQSTGVHLKTGSLGWGHEYSFSNGLNQTVQIGSNEWNVTGGSLEYFYFFDYFDYYNQQHILGTFSDAGNSRTSSFPNQAADYELSIALYDDVAPLNLFSSSEIETAVVDLTQCTRGSGMLNTRTWDQSGAIVNGYYLTYNITRVSAKPFDDDQDGLPNSWEELYFGGVTNANPDAICSNGCNTVYQAYVSGMNPNDRKSTFLISISPDRTLHWPCIPGRAYSVYYATNLLADFQPLATNIPWMSGGSTNKSDSAIGFFKIGVQLEE